MSKKVIGILIVGLATALTLAAVITCVTYTRTPVKYAVKIENLNQHPGAIIVRETWHTGTGWEQVGGDSGYFDKKQVDDVKLIGKLPPTVGRGGDHVNTYLCEGWFTGEFFDISEWVIVQQASAGEEVYPIYEVTEWYPIYPIKRDTMLPQWFFPRGYLAKADMKSSDFNN